MGLEIILKKKWDTFWERSFTFLANNKILELIYLLHDLIVVLFNVQRNGDNVLDKSPLDYNVTDHLKCVPSILNHREFRTTLIYNLILYYLMSSGMVIMCWTNHTCSQNVTIWVLRHIGNLSILGLCNISVLRHKLSIL